MTMIGQDDLNSDLTKMIWIKTEKEMEWNRSAATAKVERKRFFRAGPQESGAVTSMVRFLPNASFPLHPHPQGEEIFVLNGKFIDERGIHGPGVFLFNPEGFQHSPSTDEDGNLILVRLRQYPNVKNLPPRCQKAIDTNAMPWIWKSNGVFEKVLYPTNVNDDDDHNQNDYPERQWLEKWENNNSEMKSINVDYGGLEIFVVKGSFMDSLSDSTFDQYDWLRFPPNTKLNIQSPNGCILLCKSGGFQYAIPTSEKKV